MVHPHFGAVRRLAYLCLITAAAAACSTADYAAPIKTFSDSTDQAAQSVNELNETLAAATLSYAVTAAAKDPANNHVEVGRDECLLFDPNKVIRCQATIKMRSDFGPEVTIRREDYTNPLGNMVGIVNAIKDYANNLAAVQSDNTIEEVNDSIDSIQASLVNLSTAAGKEPPTDLPKAAGEAVKWVVGQYIETVKYRALRDATAAARKPLTQAADAFREIDKSIKLQLTQPKGMAAFESLKDMDPRNEESIRSTLAAQNAYDDVLTAPLSPMFDNLVAAHNDLADGLDGSKPLSVRAALAKLKDVQKQAQALGKIAKDLNAALKKKEESPPS